MTKILSIDGGGIRGIIPAMVLAEIERRVQQPIATLFDLVAGTSTGGIIALGLTIPKCPGAPLYAAQRFVELYQHHGPRIFSRSPVRAMFAIDNLTWKKYSSNAIEQVLAEYFGDSRLSDAQTNVLVTSYELERHFPFLFKSSNARQRRDYDFLVRDVARATSAAPTYFEPMKIPTGTHTCYYTLIDGGVFANNPAACALVEARTSLPDDDYLMVSLGTGSLAHHYLPLNMAKYWGVVRWAAPLLDIVFDGVSSTVDYQLAQLLPVTPGPAQRYYRFQTVLDRSNASLDDASPSNITALKCLANNLIDQSYEQLDQLCEALTRSQSQKE